jgi:hypothetical protein
VASLPCAQPADKIANRVAFDIGAERTIGALDGDLVGLIQPERNGGLTPSDKLARAGAGDGGAKLNTADLRRCHTSSRVLRLTAARNMAA